MLMCSVCWVAVEGHVLVPHVHTHIQKNIQTHKNYLHRIIMSVR